MTLTELSTADLIARMRTELPGATIAVVRAYRDALLTLEKSAGVGEAHRIASELIADRRRLVHSEQHDEQLNALAVSRCGNYLATGASCSEDYEAGGDLVIWDLHTGAVVHAVTGIPGGVGWSWHLGQMCWAADSERSISGSIPIRLGGSRCLARMKAATCRARASPMAGTARRVGRWRRRITRGVGHTRA